VLTAVALNYGVFTRSSKRPANFSKCIQNTRANAGRLLEVCWKFAALCHNRAGRLLAVCWIMLFKHPISLQVNVEF